MDNMPNYIEEVPEEPKKPKKKKLTKAEKRAIKLLQQQENKRIIMRDHLKRELELSKQNAYRGQEEWEEMCKEIKIVEMRQELQEWHHRAERMLKNKDDTIESMIKDMDDTYEMHSRAFAQQIEMIDYMSGTYNTLLSSLKTIYEQLAAELVETFYNELTAQEENYAWRQLYCENVMHSTNIIMEEKLKSDYSIYLDRRDEIVNSEIETRYVMRDECVEKMHALHKQLTDFVETIKESTSNPHKYERIALQTNRQENYVAEAIKNTELEEQNQVILDELQGQLLEAELEANKRLNDLKTELNYFTKVRGIIEVNIEKDKKDLLEKLKILCYESYTMKKRFDKLIKYGELLLSLALNCAKLETEREKIVHSQAAFTALPWKEEDTEFIVEEGCNLLKKEVVVDPDPEDEDQDHQKVILKPFIAKQDPGVCKLKMETIDVEEFVGISEEEIVEQMNTMKHFWRRVALVEAHNLILTDEKKRLTAENKKYINFIKNMSKTDNVNELKKALVVEGVGTQPRKPCTRYVMKRLRQ